MGQLIEWAQQSISTKFPNFAFRKADIFNKFYNPDGVFKAVDFRFPYKEESFDLIFLTSVFTHMRGAEVRHYLDEIRRVLRPGGKCLTTCFMLNGESEKLIRKGKSTQNLVHPLDDCFVVLPDVPEASLGFKENLLLGVDRRTRLHSNVQVLRFMERASTRPGLPRHTGLHEAHRLTHAFSSRATIGGKAAGLP